MRADRGCNCCEVGSRNGAGRAGQLMLQLLSSVLTGGWGLGEEHSGGEIMIDPQESFVTLPTGLRVVVTDPIIKAVPAALVGPALALGFVTVMAGELAAEARADLRLATWTDELMKRVPPLVARATRFGQERCVDCIALNVWPQTSQRVWQTKSGQTRRPR